MIRVGQAPVSLAIPADAAYIRLVRLVVASLASDLGYDYEGVEDVRIVADEVANLAIRSCGPGGSIRVDIIASGRTVDVVMRCPTDRNDVAFEPLASQLVAVLTATCTVSISEGELEIRFKCPAPSL